VVLIRWRALVKGELSVVWGHWGDEGVRDFDDREPTMLAGSGVDEQGPDHGRARVLARRDLMEEREAEREVELWC